LSFYQNGRRPMIPLSSHLFVSPINFIEADRRKSGRPASRIEILSRHQEESRLNSSFYTHDQILRSHSEEIDRRLRKQQQLFEARQAASNPAVRVRHTIGRVLIAAGERIRPELT